MSVKLSSLCALRCVIEVGREEFTDMFLTNVPITDEGPFHAGTLFGRFDWERKMHAKTHWYLSKIG